MAIWPETKIIGETQDGRANVVRSEYGGKTYTRQSNKAFTTVLRVEDDKVFWHSYSRHSVGEPTLEVANPD